MTRRFVGSCGDLSAGGREAIGNGQKAMGKRGEEKRYAEVAEGAEDAEGDWGREIMLLPAGRGEGQEKTPSVTAAR